MSIAYRKPGELKKRPIAFLSVPPSRCVHVLGEPRDHVFVDLHWVGNYSVPCMGDECTLCGVPPTIGAYLAVGLYAQGGPDRPGFTPAILFVTDGALELAQKNWRDEMVHVSRQGNWKKGRMLFEPAGTIRAKRLECFQIKERLESLWLTRKRIWQAIADQIGQEAREDDEKRFGIVG